MDRRPGGRGVRADPVKFRLQFHHRCDAISRIGGHRAHVPRASDDQRLGRIHQVADQYLHADSPGMRIGIVAFAAPSDHVIGQQAGNLIGQFPVRDVGE